MKRILAILMTILVFGAAVPLAGAEETMHEIYLAGGCFWGMEHFMSLVPGVVDAQSGYAQGTVENPTYQQVCAGDTGHRETVKVTYDAGKVALRDLLKLYFSVVDPLTPQPSGQ